MAEVAGEAKHVWASQPHIGLFLAGMRHFRDRLKADGLPVDYRQLEDPANQGTLGGELQRAVRAHRPKRAVVVQPGEWRVEQELRDAAKQVGLVLEIRPDRHFICTRREFEEHARGRKQLRTEYFYRTMRRRTNVLMDGDQPIGDQWNYDAQNRRSFGREGPGDVPRPASFQPDEVTRAVLVAVEEHFGEHPGSLAHFDWPVTPEQAQATLQDFIDHRLPSFGTFEDAMWTGEPYLFHSRLSAALNLKLLDPRAVIAAAEQAYRGGRAPLNAAEGFIRQILGWREYVRGIYWHAMPGYATLNGLRADASLPAFYWTGDTDMNCLRQCIRQTLDHGYAHHIQRLMVTGLFALLMGVAPQQVHRWYLSVYVDAVEWVEMPNTLGMSQFADGGLMASKPYCASGNYINRMSNYCVDCRYRPDQRLGEEACPFTTLYWDFLMRHEALLGRNRRMGLQLRNLRRLDADEKQAIRRRASSIRHNLGSD